MEKAGVIYILTNPSFPDFVKIGYADDIEKRLQQLNRSECVPFAFRVYATYEVNSRLSDLKIHSIIDKLNPNLRSIENFNGQKRVREFYAMTAEDAYSILEAIAEIHGCTDGERITTRGISGQLKKLAVKYNINPAVVYPHSFRHRFAKSFLERCNDIAFLADLMGHESIETTRIYLRKTSTEQREIVDSVIDW